MSETSNADPTEKAVKIRRKPERESVLSPTFAAVRHSSENGLLRRDTSHRGLLQRQCACGKHTIAGGECEECRSQRTSRMLIQRDGTHTGLTPDQRYEHTLAHAGTTKAQWEANYRDNATFLGVPISRGIHQELVDRLNLAETYLRGQFSGQSDAQIAGQVGLYSVSGRRPPRNAVGGSSITNHAYGIAIDVNYQGNPYIARSTATDDIIARATNLILGREIRIRPQQRGSLEEIRARYREASEALRAYFALRNNRERIREIHSERGLPTDDTTIDQRMAQINADYQDPGLQSDFATTDPANPRDPAAGFIDLSAELVEALGNQAGLYWGGQYRGGKDMMHFDWRQGTVKDRHRI